jgi:hypothetical protein
LVADRFRARSTPSRVSPSRIAGPSNVLIDVTRKQLAKAARQRIEAAEILCPAGVPCPRPAVAAYLAHVGVECLLKAWLLYKNKATDTHQFRAKLPPKDAEALFTARGHDLRLLADKASLKRHLVAEKASALLAGEAWGRLASDGRPYDVRYGTVAVAAADAAEEVSVAKSLLHLIERVLR